METPFRRNRNVILTNAIQVQGEYPVQREIKAVDTAALCFQLETLYPPAIIGIKKISARSGIT